MCKFIILFTILLHFPIGVYAGWVAPGDGEEDLWEDEYVIEEKTELPGEEPAEQGVNFKARYNHIENFDTLVLDSRFTTSIKCTVIQNSMINNNTLAVIDKNGNADQITISQRGFELVVTPQKVLNYEVEVVLYCNFIGGIISYGENSIQMVNLELNDLSVVLYEAGEIHFSNSIVRQINVEINGTSFFDGLTLDCQRLDLYADDNSIAYINSNMAKIKAISGATVGCDKIPERYVYQSQQTKKLLRGVK